MPSNWKKETYYVIEPSGQRFAVVGSLRLPYRLFGVRRTMDDDAWQIDHIPTGRIVSTGFPRRKQAIAAVETVLVEYRALGWWAALTDDKAGRARRPRDWSRLQRELARFKVK